MGLAQEWLVRLTIDYVTLVLDALTYILQQTGSLIYILGCWLFGAQQLPKSMLIYNSEFPTHPRKKKNKKDKIK